MLIGASDGILVIGNVVWLHLGADKIHPTTEFSSTNRLKIKSN